MSQQEDTLHSSRMRQRQIAIFKVDFTDTWHSQGSQTVLAESATIRKLLELNKFKVEAVIYEPPLMQFTGWKSFETWSDGMPVLEPEDYNLLARPKGL